MNFRQMMEFLTKTIEKKRKFISMKKTISNLAQMVI